MNPIDPTGSPDDQLHQVLTFAEGQGWLLFDHITPGPRAERLYVITVPGDDGGYHRRLRPDAVIPYVRGQADARGVGITFPDPG